MSMISFTLISNQGSGYAGEYQVEEGTTLGEFLRTHLKGETETHSVDGVTVQHNRKIDTSGLTAVIQQGDRVTITPTQIKGA